MKVTVKLFARLRELVGTHSIERQVIENGTVADLIQLLQAEFPKLIEVFPRTVVSVNREFAERETRLTDGDEVAFFPPVSGGSGADDGMFAITFEPISLDVWAAKVRRPETGAVAVFAGTVRNVSAGKEVERLEYEAYEAMAVAKLRQVAAEAREQWPKIVEIAIVQRIGHLEVGDNAVIVAVSSPHRGDGCFEACQYAINRLKQIVPIWKKEVSPDGSAWVEGDYLPSTQDTQ
ncbi:MAG: molybdopterin converting factor [Anaerolineae bacterium]|nr:MoaD family protein [Anaerolineales bacterium]MCQ3978439.1 molybdopterin converting factor [Anaerolineae bacterium]